MGPTEVAEAKEQEPECMRAQFTDGDVINGLHGSGNSEEAVQELNFFFPPVSLRGRGCLGCLTNIGVNGHGDFSEEFVKECCF